MPSKSSETLKQAIDYLRSGDTETAREIILTIIDTDPDYEKAWIWLVETVAEKDSKVEILTTRLQKYPQTSPLARKALERLAPEALFPPARPKTSPFTPLETPAEGPFQDEGADTPFPFDVIGDYTRGDRETFEDSAVLEFTEDSSALEDTLFEQPRSTPDADELADFFLGESHDDDETISPSLGSTDELMELDLEAFLRGDLAEPQTSTPKRGRTDSAFAEWMQKEEQTDEDQSEPLDELSFLLGQDTEPAGKTDQQISSVSNPFVLSQEESLHLFGEDILSEPLEDELLNAADLDSFTPEAAAAPTHPASKPTFALDEDLFALPEEEAKHADAVSADDLLELGSELRTEVVGASASRGRGITLPDEAKIEAQKKAEKKSSQNTTFIIGCSVLAVIIIISLLGMAWLFFQNRSNNPPAPTATVNPNPTATVTEAYTLVAPWLAEETPTPEGN